jgi:hypothetical protein
MRVRMHLVLIGVMLLVAAAIIGSRSRPLHSSHTSSRNRCVSAFRVRQQGRLLGSRNFGTRVM